MRRLIVPIIATLAGAAVIALLIFGVIHQAPSRTLDEAVAQGRQPPAPQATTPLPRLGSTGSSSVAAYRGKVVVLNFWASWCPPCKAEASQLEHLQRQLHGLNATVLGVTYLDNSPDSLRFVHEYGITYPNLRDADGEYGRNAYGTEQLPESFLINRHGDITKVWRGEITPEFLKSVLQLAQSA